MPCLILVGRIQADLTVADNIISRDGKDQVDMLGKVENYLRELNFKI
jgi:hypothetical protein